MRIMLIIALVVIVALGIIAYFMSRGEAPEPAPILGEQETGTAAPRTVKLFYYNPERDKDETGGVECSTAGLVPVTRELPDSETIIPDTIRLLLKGELSEAELREGISTEYPISGLTLTDSVLKDGVLTLTFSDPENKTGGGACRVGVLWMQIAQTAKQFPGVREVRFLPEELFQP